LADRRLLLLDTDIGNDIDDAICLAYLLAQPRCELLGITTVTAAPDVRARLASVLCRNAGRDVPIHPGAADPVVGPPVQESPPQAVVLDRWEHDTSFPPEPAVDFLRSTIRAHPGEVTLLTIGPLTNVALLFAADPAIPSLLDSLVSMGGSYGTESEEAEWNLHCDPHAAAQVFGTSTFGEPGLVHRAIGLNVTTRVRMPVDEFMQRCETPALRPVADMAQSWFGDRSEVVFHDPLAAATIFEQDVCSFAAGKVIVDSSPGPLAGSTMWEPKPGGRHQIAVDVRPDAFIEHYFDVVR
jgi:inosine-uridine nucleoside N-ribohydrolase